MGKSWPLTGALKGPERNGLHLDVLKDLRGALAIARRLDAPLVAVILGNVLAVARRPLLESPGG